MAKFAYFVNKCMLNVKCDIRLFLVINIFKNSIQCTESNQMVQLRFKINNDSVNTIYYEI